MSEEERRELIEKIIESPKRERIKDKSPKRDPARPPPNKEKLDRKNREGIDEISGKGARGPVTSGPGTFGGKKKVAGLDKWHVFFKDYRGKHPKVPFREAQKKASANYKARKGKGGGARVTGLAKWHTFLKGFRKSHPELSFKEARKKASASYRARKGAEKGAKKVKKKGGMFLGKKALEGLEN